MQRSLSKKKRSSKNSLSMTMAASSSSTDTKLDLMKKVRSHEVAIAELGNLSSTRTVYQKDGNLFFRTTAQKASASEQKQLDSAKAKLER